MSFLQTLERAFFVFDKSQAYIAKKLAGISSIVLGLMVLPIVLDVSVRFLFRRSVLGIIETQEFALVIVVFLALPHTENLGRNIKVDLFIERFPKWLCDGLNNIFYLVNSLILGIITWQLTLTSIKKLPIRSYSLEIRISIFIVIGAIGLFLLTLSLIKKYIHISVENIKNHNTIFFIISIVAGIFIIILPFYVEYITINMSGLTLGVLGLLFLFILMMLGMPLGYGMITTGYVGLLISKQNSTAVLGLLGTVPYYQVADYMVTVFPMFVLLGTLVFVAGISKDLFGTAQKWLGWMPGGLAVSAVAGCAGFSALSGDSLATSATMGTVAFPEMKKNNYDPSIAAGALAAGGTLGILIPPSLGFIVYALLTEASIGRLFIAGMVPGILLALLFILCIVIIAKIKPERFPPAQNPPLMEKIISLKDIWAIVLLFIFIFGGMITGIFSPNEAGAVGSFGAFLIAIIRRRLTINTFIQSLKDTAQITASLCFIIIGVGILGYFLVSTRLPMLLAQFVMALGASKYSILAAVCILYIILGSLMNVVPMMMLTLPAIFPTIIALGFDPIWFGVLMVILMEMGQITPPIGMCVFSLCTVTEVPMVTAFKGVFPFVICMIVCMLLLIVFPQIALFLQQFFF